MSIVCDHFDKVDDTNGPKVVCKHCKKDYLAYPKNHRTINLKNYLTICPIHLLGLVEKKSKGQTTLSFQPQKEGEEGE